jgi:SpoVK/Ycf46/Vps4 family AAA+-type ATPase
MQQKHQIFKACETLGGCIIFLDELDGLATSRDQGDIHEARAPENVDEHSNRTVAALLQLCPPPPRGSCCQHPAANTRSSKRVKPWVAASYS